MALVSNKMLMLPERYNYLTGAQKPKFSEGKLHQSLLSQPLHYLLYYQQLQPKSTDGLTVLKLVVLMVLQLADSMARKSADEWDSYLVALLVERLEKSVVAR